MANISSLHSSAGAVAAPFPSDNPFADSSALSASSNASANQGAFVLDYSDVGALIDNLRQRNDRALYKQTIASMRAALDSAHETPASKVPRLVSRKDGSFNLIREAPDVEYIVLPGGGAKGISYVGLMRELLKDAFPHVKVFVGSSAGSLAATFMSFGDKPKHMQQMLATELPKLLKTQPGLREIYPGLKFQNTMSTFASALWKIIGDKPLGEANGFVQKLDEVTSTAVADYLNGLSDVDLQTKLDDYCQQKQKTAADRIALQGRIDILKTPANFSKNREGAMITFSDLDILHFLDPKRFKDIQTTGFDSVTKTVKYFNVKDTPDIPVAYAARLSMSHPLLATGVQLDKRYDSSDAIYIDGGIASNIPSEAVYNHDIARAVGDSRDATDEEMRARTVVMKFDDSHDKSPAKKRGILKRVLLFIPDCFKELSKKFRDWFMRLVSDNPNASINSKDDKEKYNAAGPNGYVLYHGDLRTIEMEVSADRQTQAIDEASIGILAQLLQRKEQGYYVTVKSLSEAVERLSDEDKIQILRAGKPSGNSFGCDQAEQEFMQRKSELEKFLSDPHALPDALQKAEKQFEKAQLNLLQTHEALSHATNLYTMLRDDKDSQRLDIQHDPTLNITPSTLTMSSRRPISPTYDQLAYGFSLDDSHSETKEMRRVYSSSAIAAARQISFDDEAEESDAGPAGSTVLETQRSLSH